MVLRRSEPHGDQPDGSHARLGNMAVSIEQSRRMPWPVRAAQAVVVAREGMDEKEDCVRGLGHVADEPGEESMIEQRIHSGPACEQRAARVGRAEIGPYRGAAGAS